MPIVLVALVLLVPFSHPLAGGGEEGPAPGCQATLRGNALVTTFEPPDGNRVEGVWTVLSLRRREFERADAMLADLLLEHLAEYDALDGRRSALPMALRLRMETADANPGDALRRAIGAWCGTVERAAAEGVHVGSSAARLLEWWWI